MIKTAIALLVVFCTLPVFAGSKVIATGGATTIEGAAGGGIVPWAVINGYASSEQWAITAAINKVAVDDFTLNTKAIALSYDNNWEWSISQQRFALDSMGGELTQHIYGIKYHLAGDLLYSAMPQISAGLLYKKHQNFGLPAAVGALHDTGIDVYLASTKLIFDAVAGRNLLLNATIRATKANQTGLLGFGAVGNDHYQYLAELSAVLMLTHNLALGAEFKQKPNQLVFADEQHWRDVFVGWFINKNCSVVAGYVDLGAIAGAAQQQGYYLALEATW